MNGIIKEPIYIESVEKIRAGLRPKSILDANLLMDKIKPISSISNEKPGGLSPMEKNYYFGISKQVIQKRIPKAHLVSLKDNKALCSNTIKIKEEISLIDIKDEYGGKYEFCKHCLNLYNMKEEVNNAIQK